LRKILANALSSAHRRVPLQRWHKVAETSLASHGLVPNTEVATDMRAAAKLGLVIAGYVAALLVASLALKAWSAAAPASQGDDGMRAFGESLLFLGVLAVASVPASVAALYFLRPYAMVWRALSVVAIGIATTGLAAACLYAIGRHAAGSVLLEWASYSVLRLLISPLFVLGFAVLLLVAPNRAARRSLLAALGIEALATVSGALTLMVPSLLP
jgi:hypothetical protein